MTPLAQLVENRSGSALSDVLSAAPRLVESVAETIDETPIINLPSLFGPKPATVPSSTIDPDLAEEPYIPLTAEEIKTRAESKAEMWGAIMAMCFGFINRYTAYQKIREGDKQLVRDYEQYVKLTKETPNYSADHPYFAARERWNEFEEALESADEEARLTPPQLTLLRRSIEADLKAKNKRGTLKTGSIMETLLEIMVMKSMTPLMQVGMMRVNRMVDKTMR